jgi:CRP/FNR family transcriptional regulator, cyclic AMP receptor protein
MTVEEGVFQWEDLQSFLPRTEPAAFKKGQTIYSGSEIPDALYLVESGVVALVDQREDCTAVKRICFAEEFFGEGVLLGIAGEHAIAIADCKILAWTGEELRRLLTEQPDFAIAFSQELAKQAKEYGDRIVDMVCQPVPALLAAALLSIGERSRPDSPSNLNPIPHKILAQFIGTSREVVTHYLNEFRRSGLLRYSRKEMTIDRDALLARFPSAKHRRLMPPAQSL